MLLTPARKAAILQMAETDPLLQNLIAVVQSHAEQHLTASLFPYSSNSDTFKDVRRESMLRVFNMGLMYQLTGDTRYSNKVKQYLLQACQYSNWHPNHFLQTGEMAAWVALGYDWIFDQLTDSEAATIRQGLMNKAILPGLNAYRTNSLLRSDHNWNQVCNGGLLLAALAVAEHYPVEAETTVYNAINAAPNVLKSYLPDGDWFEGPTYYAYGTTYQAMMIQALRDALGTDLGFSAMIGYEQLGQSGDFLMHTIGSSGRYFDFGDAKPYFFFSPVVFWLSHAFNRADYAWWSRMQAAVDLPRMQQHPSPLMQVDTLDRFLALMVVWYNDAGSDLGSGDFATARYFRGESGVGAMRSEWTSDAIYLGFKGGLPTANHAHMDSGSFVLDALGIRWAIDLGGDNYNLSGYFSANGPRWQYYRLNNHGHNTLVIGGQLQNHNANSAVVHMDQSLTRTTAVVDLSQAYSNAGRTLRGYALVDNRQIVIEDQIESVATGTSIRWGMLTEAEIQLNGNRATLLSGGKYLHARIISPEGAVFEIISSNPYQLNPSAKSGQATNAGTRMLGIKVLSGAEQPVQIRVVFEPSLGSQPSAPTDFRPIEQWHGSQESQLWQQQRFELLPGGSEAPEAKDLADPDADGVKNLLEYAFNGPPLNANRAVLPRTGRIGQDGQLFMTITYRRWSGGRIAESGDYIAKGLRYQLLHSNSVSASAWTADASLFQLLEEPSPLGDGMEEVTYQFIQPVSNGPKFIAMGIARL